MFVLGHHRGLDLHTAGDSRGEVQTVEVRAVQEMVLGHLTQPAQHLSLGEGVQGCRVAQHGDRLPEGTDQVLALG